MSSQPDLLLQRALAAHRDGRVDEAEAGYHQVLAARAEDPTALYWLGLLRFHRGDAAQAVQYLTRSLARAPAHARGWKDLGGILMAQGRIEEAATAYRRALEVSPALAESWYNLGICCARLGDLEGAIRNLRSALQREPGYLRAYEPLATYLYQTGDAAAAAEIYREWVRRDPRNPRARHLAAAATGGASAPERASDDYVRAHFDSAAKSFDTNLQQLGYHAPEQVAAALATLASSPVQELLDAGCGTGLSGPLLRPRCVRLVGVDLSPAMLARAAARGCYDQLIEAELTRFMVSQPHAFDVIVCVDTLVYFGPLEEPLSAARRALKQGGLLLCTLEAGSEDHRLQIHGRYTHGEAYVRRALSAAGLKLHTLRRQSLRQERLSAVAGHLVIARRA